MSAAKHTPSWRVRNVQGLGPIVESDRGAHIATVHAATKAPLIAAAPELLAALHALVAAVEDHDADSLRELIAAHAAIAKATGSTS